MRKMLTSFVLGFGSAFVAWAAVFSVIDLTEMETTQRAEHKAVIAVGAVLLFIGLVMFRRVVDPGLALLGGCGGTLMLWQERAMPTGPGYTTEYWSAVVVASLIFVVLAFSLQSDYFFRSRR